MKRLPDPGTIELPDPFAPWLDELLAAAAAGDGDCVLRVARAIDTFGFHEQRHAVPDRWEQFFGVLLELLTWSSDQVFSAAYHWLIVVLWSQHGPPYLDPGSTARSDDFRRRRAALLGVLPRLFEVRGSNLLLRLADDLRNAEELCDVAPQPAWLADERGSAALSGVDRATITAATIAYTLSRKPWSEAQGPLLSALDDDNTIVRAYSARTIGAYYQADRRAELSPSLPDMVNDITRREFDRPGVAGPFLGPFYAEMDLEAFETRSGVRVRSWLYRIVTERTQPEPDLLPCSNGIDFFAHEQLAGHAESVRGLLDTGNVELAIETATEIRARLPGLEPILMELGAHADDEVCRRASWHLAYHYRVLHPEGARRGFVQYRRATGYELFLNVPYPRTHPSWPYAAIAYPDDGDIFEDALAWHVLDHVLPPAMRGELVPHPASVMRKPGVYVLGNAALYAYGSGAMVSFEGNPGERRWQTVTVIWHGTPGAWTPGESIR